MNKYYTSSGEAVSEATIKKRLRDAYKWAMPKYVCECCGKNRTDDHDHTLPQAKCKQLHKTELIWDEENWSYSCRTCHNIWESYKSGIFQTHKNVVKRMLYLKKHALEEYKKRLNYIDDNNILIKLNEQNNN